MCVHGICVLRTLHTVYVCSSSMCVLLMQIFAVDSHVNQTERRKKWTTKKHKINLFWATQWNYVGEKEKQHNTIHTESRTINESLPINNIHRPQRKLFFEAAVTFHCRQRSIIILSNGENACLSITFPGHKQNTNFTPVLVLSLLKYLQQSQQNLRRRRHFYLRPRRRTTD